MGACVCISMYINRAFGCGEENWRVGNGEWRMGAFCLYEYGVGYVVRRMGAFVCMSMEGVGKTGCTCRLLGGREGQALHLWSFA